MPLSSFFQACCSADSALPQLTADYLLAIMRRACEDNDLPLLETIVDKLQSDDLNEAFRIVCSRGFDGLATYLLERGANDITSGLQLACEGQHTAVVAALASAQPVSSATILETAVATNDLEKARVLLDGGIKIYDRGLIAAVRGGNLEMVQYFIDQGATDFTRAVYVACESGQDAILEYLLSLGADLWKNRFVPKYEFEESTIA